MPAPPLLFEMMRSFVSLAETLNLSRTVEELNSTRQTVRRHIATLEQHKGGPLFAIRDRKYHLTDLGRHALIEADELVIRADAWVGGHSYHVNGLQRLGLNMPEGYTYCLQQQPLSRIWQDSSPLIQEGFQTWARSCGEIESPQYRALRPWLMVFRRHHNEWICVDVGERSSYSNFYGWAWQRSTIGRPISALPGGHNLGRLLTIPFENVRTLGHARLDHIFTSLTPKHGPNAGTLVPVSYQRLLTGCRFPDGSFALASLIDRTYNIDIEGVSREEVRSMDEGLVMNVDIHAELADRHAKPAGRAPVAT
ncbi:LysR family transcriptional regulator [Aliiroseovarius sp.]|uniref:helix-turn-helix domain-containing protein n=1 Tax=Aliiroseovarius sp. TaxID=1872442 RepID=UPI002602923A|nr:LysR family transcriptional regulator [Aliiroseovarius sp.]